MLPTYEKPYYAVIFTSIKKEEDPEFDIFGDKTMDIVKDQEGFLGVESYCNKDGSSVTISYWQSLEAIKHWRHNPIHAEAMAKGIKKWYDRYTIRVCKVERDHDFSL